MNLTSFLKSRGGRRWVVLDFLIGFFALLIALNITPYVDVYEPVNRVIVSLAYGFSLVIAVRLCGLNSLYVSHSRSKYEIIIGAIQGCLLAYVAVSLIVGFTHVHIFGRYVMVVCLGLSLLGIMASRALDKYSLNKHPIRIAFLGCNELLKAFGDRLVNDPHFEVVCAACQDDCDIPEVMETYHYMKVEDPDAFCNYLDQQNVDIVVSCYGSTIPVRVHKVVERLPFYKIEVMNKGSFLERYFREISVTYRNLHWYTSQFIRPNGGAILFVKRILDIFVATIGLAITLPIWPILFLLIKWETPGPAIYKQCRVGLLGKNFTIYKFRTMGQDAEKKGAQWASTNDPRVTRLGAFLRRTRLDELPQLWNVLKGDMSLIGPRPERPEFVEELKKVIPLYEWRYLVPPGLTGWAQICYGYGSTVEDAKRKLQFDLYYVKNFSVQLELQILLRTIPLMMRGSR